MPQRYFSLNPQNKQGNPQHINISNLYYSVSYGIVSIGGERIFLNFELLRGKYSAEILSEVVDIISQLFNSITQQELGEVEAVHLVTNVYIAQLPLFSPL